MNRKKIAYFMTLAALCGSLEADTKGHGCKANWKPVRMKGLSAEQMGTANSRKKSQRKRKKNRRKKNG